MRLITNFITKHISPEFTEKLESVFLGKSKRQSKDLFDSCCENLRNSIKKDNHSYSENLVRETFSTYGEELRRKLRKETKDQVDDQVEEQVRFLMDKFVISMEGVIQLHDISIIKGEHKMIKGVFHEKFDTVLKLVKADLPVFLSGPAGSGKNVLCKQVAETLELDFHFTNAVTQEYRLTGFIDAMGKYHETEFYKAFKDGGVFFLDEMDASIPEVLVILNAAIANRYFEFPCGRINAHPDFRIIAAGNTFGTGADNTYTGRYCLDGASLDRFSVIEINYSPAIETFITNSNQDLMVFCRKFREITKRSGIDCLFSYRALTAITKLEGSLGLREIFKICVTKGIKGDDLKTIQGELQKEKFEGNKYVNSFLELK